MNHFDELPPELTREAEEERLHFLTVINNSAGPLRKRLSEIYVSRYKATPHLQHVKEKVGVAR